MYPLSNKDQSSYCHIVCECGRSYIPEEMYICFKYCLQNEYEIFSCKNNCTRSRIISSFTDSSHKSICEYCFQCPICLVSTHPTIYKKKVDGQSVYIRCEECTHCKWSSKDINFNEIKEVPQKKEEHNTKKIEIDKAFMEKCKTLYTKCSKGILKSKYDKCLNILKNNKNLVKESNEKGIGIMSSELYQINECQENNESQDYQDNHDIVSKAQNDTVWDIKNLEESLKEIDNEYKKKQEEVIYDDNYNNDNTDELFNEFKPYFACALDYENNDYFKYNNVDELIDTINKNFDIYNMSTYKQKFTNVSLQHSLVNNLFISFVDTIPQKEKMNRKCKTCGKGIVNGADLTGKKNENEFIYCYVYIKYFPSISIYKVEPDQLLLKFSKFETKNISINFMKDFSNECKVELPDYKYNMCSLDATEIQNKYINKQTEHFLVLSFPFLKENDSNEFVSGSQHVLSFIICSEYSRDSTNIKTIQYKMEIKFTVN